MLVYKTSLSEAFWNILYPKSVAPKYHLQNALFKFNLGYYFKFINIFPLNLRLASIWSTIDYRPNCLSKVLNTFYLFAFNLVDINENVLVKMFFMRFGPGFCG